MQKWPVLNMLSAFTNPPYFFFFFCRSPCRFGPRQIRTESALLRAYNSATRAAPYESLMVADIGDVNVNLYDLKDTCKRITEAYRKILATGCIPLTMGEKVAVGNREKKHPVV